MAKRTTKSEPATADATPTPPTADAPPPEVAPEPVAPEDAPVASPPPEVAPERATITIERARAILREYPDANLGEFRVVDALGNEADVEAIAREEGERAIADVMARAEDAQRAPNERALADAMGAEPVQGPDLLAAAGDLDAAPPIEAEIATLPPEQRGWLRQVMTGFDPHKIPDVDLGAALDGLTGAAAFMGRARPLIAEVLNGYAAKLRARLDALAPPAPPSAPPTFRVVKTSRFITLDGIHELREGSIVSEATHDLAAVRAQNIPIEPCAPPEAPKRHPVLDQDPGYVAAPRRDFEMIENQNGEVPS